MAETEKKIEAMEKEVSEASVNPQADAPKKHAVAAEPSHIAKMADYEDLGAAVVKPTDSNPDASKKINQVSGDAQQKNQGAADAMPKLKEGSKETEKTPEDKEDQKEMAHMDADKKKKDEMANMYASYHSAAMSKTKDEMYKEMMHGMDKMKKEGMKKLHAAVMPSKMKAEEATDAKTDIHIFRYNGAVWQEVGRTMNLSES